MEWPFCVPRISAHVFPLDGELDFYFENDFIFKKNDLESPLIFVLFLKGKQNKKENPKCDSLFWKRWSVEKRIEVQGSGYLSRRYGKDHSTLLSP